MRRIVSKEEQSKKQRRNQIIVGVVLILVMIVSTFGIVRDSFGNESSTSVKYSGIEFVKQNGFWIAEIGGFNLIVRYNPYETEKISAQLNSLETYYDIPLYLSSENNEAIYEIYNNFEKIAERIQMACLEKNNCDENLPVKSCENNFIIITKNKTASVVQKDNCVFISGPEENLTKITDDALFEIFGIEQ